MSAAPVLYLTGMGGLGDNVYQRPFVKAAAQDWTVYLSTPWPEMYADVPGLRFVPPWNMDLRTQQKHMRRVAPEVWAPGVPHHDRTATFWYGLQPHRSPCGIIPEMGARTGIDLSGRWSFDLPHFGASPVCPEKPIAFLRPVTTRREWKNNARAPEPAYVTRAAEILQSSGFYVVAVADIDPPHEWLEGDMPPADLYFTAGELTMTQMMALLQRSAVVVGGVGFIVPAAIAAGVPLVCINGGQGGQNARRVITDPRMDLTWTRFIEPDRFCMCRNRAHQCDKRITGFDERFVTALSEVAPTMERAA